MKCLSWNASNGGLWKDQVVNRETNKLKNYDVGLSYKTKNEKLIEMRW